MDEITTPRPQNAVVKYYKPSELLGMFTSYLSQQDVNRQVIYLQGIYLKNPKHDPRWTSRYDILRDENTQTEITLQIPHKLCEDLKDGNLVTVGGVLGRRVQNNSHIQLMLVVSRVEVVQEQAIDENEIKRMELRRKKAATGFRNVDALLEQLLYTDQRPKIALLFAGTSITMTDFIQGGGDIAKAAFDFAEFRANFSRTAELANTIKGIDAQSYSAIAIVRGGGSGIEALDELDILEAVANLKTPFISAIGHPDEKLFIKELADREVSVPNDLGHYFKDMMETVNEKKTKSRAVLTEQIKKQFKDQLEAGQKQNKELQEKLAKKANKQNEELQKKLTEINKANETAQKTHAEQLGKLQVQLKAQTEASTKQSKEFNESLKKMQDTNGQLQKTLEKMTAQNNQTSKELNDAKDKARQLEKQLSEAISKNGNNIWMIVAIIAIIALVAVLIFR